MKRNCALLIFFLAAAFVYGQQVVDVPKQNDNYIYRSGKVKAYEAQFFGCPECDFISKVPGVCPNHQLTLLRFGTYYCPSKYHYTSSKRGSCPEHKIALKEMEMKYKQPYSAPEDKKNGK